MGVVTQPLVLPPFTASGMVTHRFATDRPPPVFRGNKDATYTLGDPWSFICRCRTSDWTTAIPDILNCHVDYFLTDLDENTLIHVDMSGAYVAVVNVIDAQVQVYIPIEVQLARSIVPGNYYQVLQVTSTSGITTIQTKGRVKVLPAQALLPAVVPDDDIHLSESPFHPVSVAPLVFSLVNATSYHAAHGYGYTPDVWLLNNLQEVVETDISHTSGAVDLSFPAPFTGTLFVR